MPCAISLLSRITVQSPQVLNTSGNWRMATQGEVNAGTDPDGTAIQLNNILWGIGTSAIIPPASYVTGSFAPGASIGSGAFLWIDPDNVTPGIYYLAYVVGPPGGCQDISLFTLTVQAGVDAGIAPAAQTFCADDNTNHSVFALIGGSPTAPCATRVNPPNGERPCGVFSGTATSGAQWSSVNLTFNPSLAGVTSGSQTFTLFYTTQAPQPYDSSCIDGGYCTDQISFNITVTAAGYAGENSAITLCNAP